MLQGYPWGALPYLRVGQKYINGSPSELFTRGTFGNVTIPDPSAGKICSGFDIPSNLYYLHGDSRFGREKVWKFSDQGRDYYVPCMELISAFFASNKTFANAILKPYGLDTFIDSAVNYGSSLRLELNSTVPRSILNTAFVLQLSWLTQNAAAKSAWDSVYNGLFQNALKADPVQPVRALSMGFPVEVKPPDNGNLRWMYRGIAKGHSVLILEITELSGIPMPFSEIEYSHPSLRSSVTIRGPRKIGGVKGIPTLPTFNIDDTNKTVKVDTDQTVLQVEGTVLSFSRLPIVKKRAVARQQASAGGNLFIGPGPGGVMEPAVIEAGLDEPVFGGERTPVEFARHEIVKRLADAGFWDFCKAVEYLLDIIKDARVSLNILAIPDGKSFSHCHGHRRTCAVLLIERAGKQPYCILEIFRPDGWMVSTLLVRAITEVSNSAFGGFVNTLLYSLIQNGGHWETVSDSNFLLERIKHKEGQEPSKWGQRIAVRLEN